MTVLEFLRDRRVWAAVVIELLVQLVAAAWLDGWAVGAALAVTFGVFAGYMAWLWERGATTTSTMEGGRRRGGG